VRITLLLLLLAPKDRYEEASEKVRFPAAEKLVEWAEKGDLHRRILIEFTDRKKYAAGLRRIEEKMGVFRAELDIEVEFEETDDRRPARAGGKEGKGRIYYNLKRLAEYQRKADDFEAERRAGHNLVWVVPPPTSAGIIAHELTHVICGTFEEKWLTEGIACWVADDHTPLQSFNHRKGKIESLDLPVSEDDAYPRGLLFFLWMEQRWNRDMVRKFVGRVAAQGSHKDALFDATGNTWARMAGEEQGWSQEYCKKLRK
jgi:hypothetical protein